MLFFLVIVWLRTFVYSFPDTFKTLCVTSFLRPFLRDNNYSQIWEGKSIKKTLKILDGRRVIKTFLAFLGL